MPDRPPIHAYLEGPEPLFPAILHPVEHLLGRLCPTVAAAPVHRYGRAGRAAQQFVYRPACCLAGDVPQRDVDGPDYERRHSRDAVAGAQNQRLPMPFHEPGVLALEGRLDGLLDVSLHDAGVAAVGLSEPHDPLIRINADQQPASPEQVACDIGNLHLLVLGFLGYVVTIEATRRLWGIGMRRPQMDFLASQRIPFRVPFHRLAASIAGRTVLRVRYTRAGSTLTRGLTSARFSLTGPESLPFQSKHWFGEQ